MAWQHGFRTIGTLRFNSATRRATPLAVMAAAAGLIATTSTADAFGSLFWPDSDVGYYHDEPAPPPPPKRRAKTYPTIDRKLELQHKQASKPQGPLVISVSIAHQSMKVYDANGLFAETPVSTGMRGHSTPMGVFSIIQKNKFHRSNLYSGAPMPYMQRITWSGVALHAGALPGYPASHGCIRMPMSFAMKLWNWTRMGSRVVITPGEVAPQPFSHPTLVAQKPSPTQNAAAPEDGRLDAARADAGEALAAPPSDLNLRPALNPSSEPTAAPRAQIRTADAGSLTSATPTASDAGAPAAEPAAAKEAAPPAKAESGTDSQADTGKADANKAESNKAEANKTETNKAEANKAEAGKADTAAEAKPAAGAAAGADAKPASTDAAAKPETAPAPKRSGQIAAFISGKDSRLYVRQEFAPLFDVPVEITASDRPLGTHVFTARLDKDNGNAISWSVLSMPQSARQADASDDSRTSRRRKTAEAADEVKAKPQPNSAAEALDRLKIPAEAMARIAAELSTGASLIVSDHGIASGETGAGTGFIIPLR